MFKKIRDFNKTTDGKVLLENPISLSFLQIIGMTLPLIALPYVLRVFGSENYGIIVFSALLIAYFLVFTDFSFKFTAARDVAFFRDSTKKLNLIFKKANYIKVIYIHLSRILFVITKSFESFYRRILIYIFTIPVLQGQAFSLNNFSISV